jgi:hypothetical protein
LHLLNFLADVRLIPLFLAFFHGEFGKGASNMSWDLDMLCLHLPPGRLMFQHGMLSPLHAFKVT